MRCDIWINEHAVSTVVSAILLLAVLTTFLAAINSYYIPSLIADHEIHHMQDVRNSFMEIAAAASPGSSKERVLVPLGDGGMPFISSLSSSGSLTVSPDKGKIEITMTGARPVEYQELEYNDTANINNIQSLSHLTLKIKDSGQLGTYNATINNADKIEVTISDTQVNVKTTDSYELELYSETVLTGSLIPKSFCLDLLNPSYGFNEVVTQQSSPFNLRVNGITDTNYFDIGYTILLDGINVNPISAQGQICYKSGNNQWIDQNYIFENGAVILKQGSNSTIRSQPFFKINSAEQSLEMCLFNITGKQDSIGGNGVVVVNVFGTEGRKYEYRNVETTTLAVTSDYTEAWEDYLERNGATIDPNAPSGTVIGYFNNGWNVSITTSDVDIVLLK
ncbi:hypothetical protein [Methanomethylovorans sp.]|uniref:DUF7289 family protein n=1 Tax=Methanomethylovorans sp. TaxID=2758717 RepID=UPI00345F069E